MAEDVASDLSIAVENVLKQHLEPAISQVRMTDLVPSGAQAAHEALARSYSNAANAVIEMLTDSRTR